MAGLPENVRDLVEREPVEDLILALLREALPGVAVQSQFVYPQPLPVVIARRDFSPDSDEGNRFVDLADVKIQSIAPDPDGDRDAALLAEAVRVALREAWTRQTIVPGIGYLTSCQVRYAPRRVADWVTASGPVQYADLPEGTWRYESTYAVAVRRLMQP
ncbi:hypothetical protein [Salininema proteolyticum]|uniref:Tail terminator n=1 Tax=Salininema proteolyticum TaxID=1607685 RepID=A0ABV8U0S8_9ACTN